jgi:hypothetical protein
MTLVGTSLTLWTGAQGVPERFVWEGRRYRVTDTPTPLEFELSVITHPVVIPTGWRCQGTDESGDSLIFDIARYSSADEWHVIRTYR